MAAQFGTSPIRCAPYVAYGTAELAEVAVAALEGRAACLLADHGVVVLGPTLARAMWLAVELETLARQYVLSLQIGGPTLSPENSFRKLYPDFRPANDTTPIAAAA